MVNRKINFLAQSGLVPESLAFRLACTAEVICRVVNGRSLPHALSTVFSGMAFSPSTRGAIQDISYHVLRNLGLVRFLTEKLTRKLPEPLLLQNLLHCALVLLLPENGILRYEPYTVVDQAVQAAASIRTLSKANGLVNAVLRRFLREQTDLLEAARQRP